MQRYRMYQRNKGVYYLEDLVTKKQESLQTRNRQQALALYSAKNQAASQPFMNILLAKAYLSAQSPELLTRTWADVMELISQSY